MTTTLRRTAAALVAGALAIATLAGCDGDDSTDPDPTGSSTTAPGRTQEPTPEVTTGPEDVVTTLEVDASPGTIQVSVLPLVRTDDGLVLTLDIAAAGLDDPNVATELSEVTASATIAITSRWLGFRLIDLATDTVAPVALDDEQDAIVSTPVLSDRAEEGRIQLLFGDLGGDELALLVPQGELVTGIPVIEGDVPEVPDEQEPLPLDRIATAEVYPLSAYSYDLLSTTRTDETSESLTIALGSDVLFDIDSAELSNAAMAVIEDAAAELQTREPGTVQVIGHTDNRLDEAYNQDLSERRAQAVADALADLIDTDDYPLEVSGRGETEPVAPNSTEAGRTANRRVELVLETEVQQQSAETGETPEATGPVATGAEGVEVEEARPYRITAEQAWVVEGHVVVAITVTALDDEARSVFGPALFDGDLPGWLVRAERFRTMAGIAVLDGSVATLPLTHPIGIEGGERFPLTDLATFSRLDGGDSRTSVVVYPQMEVGDTLTIQLLDVDDPESAWRLTDIPVSQG